MEITKPTVSSSKENTCDFNVEDASSRNESVANVEVIPEAEVLVDISTETKQEIASCKDDASNENTNPDNSSYDEEVEIALIAAVSVRTLATSCRSIVTTATHIFSAGSIKLKRAIESIDQVQHAEKVNLMVTKNKYINAEQIILNKSYLARKAVERANDKACKAEAAVTRLDELRDKKLNFSEDVENEVIIAKTAARKAAINAWKAADYAVKATKNLWQEIDYVRNLEASLKKLIERIGRKTDYSILYKLVILVLLVCIAAAAINAYFKIGASLYLISMTGCMLLLGSLIVSFFTCVDEERSDIEMEKPNVLEIVEKRLHRLTEDLETKKASFLFLLK